VKLLKKFLKLLLLTILFVPLLQTLTFATSLNANEFTVKPLPYTYDALEPYIDKETMTIHHDKHYKTYGDNLNKSLSKYPEIQNETLEKLLLNIDLLPKEIQESVKNNGGGAYNHEFFWNIMTPNSTKKPSKTLAHAIDRDFGSFDNFKNEFKKASLARFGSGWCWLLSDENGKLTIQSTANQDTPLLLNLKPIIALDV
jgi:Fe-Mn family superoxide dismutase